jgi:hypothetical protein
VDGLNIHTHEPVKWISPKGGDPLTATETEEWVLSNFASQQTLLRTLDGLSTVTGESKYRDAAKEAIKYAFENLTAPNGLFYWGHYVAYDALKDEVKYASSKSHILKVHYPYYDLMWQVDQTATERFIDAFWSAHVIDWSDLDFNRIAPYSDSLEKPWGHEYSEHPVFFQGKRGGGGFFNTGTSLAYAAATLSRMSQEDLPLIWSKRLIRRFIDTRHPATGMIKYLYNQLPLKVWRDDSKDYFSDPRSFVFPAGMFAEMRDQYQPEDVWPYQWMSVFLAQGTDINAKDDDGSTALHIAASNKNIELVEFLIEHGADVNAKNDKGYTPLYSAIWNSEAHVIWLLVRNGADVNYTPENDHLSS